MVQTNTINEADVRLLSIPEVCKRLGVTHWSVYQQIHKKALKTIRIGKRRLVSLKALNDFITEQEQ